LQIRLFLHTPKWIFISGPDQLAHAKIAEKRPKKGYETIEKDLKSFKKNPNF
jgi:hypothetical protein